MKTMKKVICLMLAMVLGLSLSGVVVSAASNDNGVLGTTGFEVRNVKFMRGGVEIFTIPASGEVSADVVISHPTGGTVVVILAAYDSNNTLLTADVTTAQEVIAGLPTISTGAIDVAGAATVKAMVWDNTQNLKPVPVTAIANEYVLNDVSRDTRITGYTLKIKNGETFRTYQGLINHDLKTVQFYVPSIYLGDWSSSNDQVNYYGSSSGVFGAGTATNLLGKTNSSTGAVANLGWETTPSNLMNVNLDQYKSALITREEGRMEVSEITLGTGATQVGEVTNPDLYNGQSYTIRAENGETATYTVKAEALAVPYISNFNSISQATTMTADEIAALKEAGTETDWVTYSSAATNSYRSGMFATTGRSGGGFWRFGTSDAEKYPPVTYQYYNGDTAKAYAFAEDSPITLTLPYKTDSTTDKYAEFVFGNKVDKVNYELICSNSGMKARESVFVSFDYKLDPVDENNPIAGTIRVNLRHKGSDIANSVMMRSGEVLARAAVGDSNYGGAAATGAGYTTVNKDTPYAAADSQWHNVQIVQRIVDGYASATGQKAMILEVYVDGNYAGYTYKTDYDDIAISADRISFLTGYNTQLKFSLDDFVWGTPFEIVE